MKMKILLAVILVILIIVAVSYAKFYLNYVVPNPNLSTKYQHKYHPLEKTILTGIIIHNPIRDAYQRGIETCCWDNQLASHLLQLDEKIENQDNPPAYLREAWTLFKIEGLKYKNIIPVFIINRNFSNLYGFLWERILAKFEGKRVQVEGYPVIVKPNDQDKYNESWECRSFFIESISLIKEE